MTENDTKNAFYFISILLALLQYFAPSFVPNNLPKVDDLQGTPAPTAVLGEKTVIASVSATVVRVVDGDTVRVSINNEEKTIRLIGINTPETVDPRREVECFGKEASNKAKELLNGQTVYLEGDNSQDNVDKYNRLLRYIWLRSGVNFNRLMIREGYAYEYTYDLPYKYQSEFQHAQLDAQNEKKGLWAAATCAGVK